MPAAWASALSDKAKHPADHGSLPGLSHHFGTAENTHSAHEVIPQRLKEIKAKNVTWIRGVDGRKLAASSGRLRTMGKHLRLSWTDSSSKERCVKRLQLGNTYTLGLANAWGMLGCSLSHMMVLRRGLAARSPYFIILENDCRSSAPQLFWQMVKTALATMPKHWSLLQLGSATAGNVSEKVCAHHELREGSDFQAPRCREMLLGARLPHLGNWRRRDVALDGEWSHPGHSLHVYAIFRSPRKDAEASIFSFLPKLGRSMATAEFDPSTTCTLQSWRKALAGTLTSRQKKTQKSKYNGARAILNAKITKKAVRSVKKAAGEAGGLKQAGNGSSVKSVRKKTQKLLTSYRRTGTWPSKREAYHLWQVSDNLWGRLKAEHVR